MGYNPLAALNAISPSLIGYMGGGGKALQSIGNSISSIGQTKLDLEKQKEDERIKNAQLDLMTKADTRAQAAQDYTQQQAFQTRNDKLNSNVYTNSLILGKEAPPEMSNDYAKLSMIDPEALVKMAKANAKEWKGKYEGSDGRLYNLWSDGTSSEVMGGATPFIDKAFTVDTQYVGGKPVKVGTSLLSGQQNSVQLPGVTDTYYNTEHSGKVNLSNTLTSQANSAKLGLQYAPLVQDAKNANTVENTIQTVVQGGFKNEIDPGTLQFYINNAPAGQSVNYRAVKINGVDKYYVNPDKLFIRPATR